MVIPVPTSIEDDGTDRMIVRFDPGGPIDLAGLGASFSALARIYERGEGQGAKEDEKPRLFISRLRDGSVIAEVVPYAVMLGQAVPYMQSAMVVANFTNRVGKALKAFAGEGESSRPEVSLDDARDIKEFVRPLVARKGANLQISHARYERREEDREVLIEYTFAEQELNRATLTIDNMLSTQTPVLEVVAGPSIKPMSEVALFFDQAGRGIGKESGRTGDRVIVPSVSSKALPVYFRKGAGDLKERMVKGKTNPLTDAVFIVDLEVQYLDEEPKAYMVDYVHGMVGDT